MNKYETIKKIGEGSHSNVYLIKNIKNNKLFVWKEIEIMFKEKIDKIRFYREISILKNINHCNIIEYYESFIKNNNFLCMVFEYVENKDLRYFINKMKKEKFSICIELLIKWIYQLTKIIFVLKENNIIHRDIKPENILIDNNYNLKLCDFGVSIIDNEEEWNKEKEYLWNTNNLLIGTCNYMSLELFYGERQSFSSDIWSYACIIYELVFLNKWNYSQNLTKYVDILEKFNNLNIKVNIYPDFIQSFLRKILVIDSKKRLKISEIINLPEFNKIYDYYKNIIKPKQ